MDLATQVAIIATFAALMSALGAILTLLRLRRAEQATFFLQMTDRYNHPEMQQALQELASWYKDNPADFVERWKRELTIDNAEGRQLEISRRQVNRYFTNISQLYRAGYIDKKLASMLINVSGINIYYQVVIPMGIARYGVTENKNPDTLKRIQRKHGAGLIR